MKPLLPGESGPVVFVVDDDLSIREALSSLIRSEGLRVETFSCAKEFLDEHEINSPACLVLDVNLPDLNGLALQNALAAAANEIPVKIQRGRVTQKMQTESLVELVHMTQKIGLTDWRRTGSLMNDAATSLGGRELVSRQADLFRQSPTHLIDGECAKKRASSGRNVERSRSQALRSDGIGASTFFTSDTYFILLAGTGHECQLLQTNDR